MLKFFRKIRRGHLFEGRTGKYLTYAIGEIALVVIGILIALSINNWNDRRAKRKAELDFYRNTKLQLLDDAGNIEGQVQYNDRYAQQFDYAIGLITSNALDKTDTLGQIAVNLTKYSDFDRQGNIYETTVNSGDIKLLRNTQIVDRLRRLEETYIYINRMETIHFEIVMSIAPDLTENIQLASGKVEDEQSVFGLKFQNYFFLSLKVMHEKDQVYHRALEEIDSIVELIENELEVK